MSLLYDAISKVDGLIREAGKTNKEFFQAKGQISMKAGFVLSTIGETSPDDPAKLKALKEAVKAVLGKELK
jgi:hypothetical protein